MIAYKELREITAVFQRDRVILDSDVLFQRVHKIAFYSTI